MKRALAIFSLSFLAVGCASLGQETRVHHGPFGRTEIGAYVIAADPSSSKMLVQTYDGDLWVYDVTDRAAGRLGTLRVGDEVNLAFDDRVAGKSVLGIDVVEPGRHALPLGIPSVAQLLPYGVGLGAPAVAPTATVTAGGAVANTGIPLAATGLVGGGVVVGPGGVAAPGVIVPGFASLSTVSPGVLTPQGVASLGLVPGVGVIRTAPDGTVVAGAARAPVTTGNFSPGTLAPGVTTANPAAPGAPVIQGPFTPGTVAPGASTANPTSPGAPVIQGPFTPGTIAPGVSPSRGTAPPASGTATSGAQPAPATGRDVAPRVQQAPTTTPRAGTGAAAQPGTTTPAGTTAQPGTAAPPRQNR
jgi:hypothetical protein